jgi:transcriptional regulator with XRE-family HTH domain
MERKVKTNASRAREAAGLSLEQAARKARIGPRYLRGIELHGGAPYVSALRLARIYKCPITYFLFQQNSSKRSTRNARNPKKPVAKPIAVSAANKPIAVPQVGAHPAVSALTKAKIRRSNVSRRHWQKRSNVSDGN